MGFYSFLLVWLKRSCQNAPPPEKLKIIPKIDLKMTIFERKMLDFLTIPENTFFCHKFMPETVFDGMWAFMVSPPPTRNQVHVPMSLWVTNQM